tara:strand:- start:357 stop:551 length:195 start_codon:yes stop_codon:yes gene_type:complete
MKVGDLVRWANPARTFFVGHTGIVLKLEIISDNDGAWIHWFTDEYGPQEAWTPTSCIEVVNESR